MWSAQIAVADPISDKRAEATRLAQQIDSLGNKESALAERYNAAVLQADGAAAQVRSAKAAELQALDNAAITRGRVEAVAIDEYVRGAKQTTGNVLATADPSVANVYSNVVGGQGTDALDALRGTLVDLRHQRTVLAAAEAHQRVVASEIETRRNDVSGSEAQLTATLRQVKGELATLVAQAEAAKEAADAARAAAMARAAAERQAQIALQEAAARQASAAIAAATASGGAATTTAQFVPAPSSGAAAVAVAEALRQVGKPYVWAAAGPDAFDCSGLTMWAWRAAGVSLSHYTGAQYAETAHIPLSDLQPGDLVYTGDMGHMAMYVGNGNMVEAPHTGALVRVVPLRPEMVLASRP